MDPSTPAITPLRQRMLDGMRLRKLCDKTQTSYIRRDVVEGREVIQTGGPDPEQLLDPPNFESIVRNGHTSLFSACLDLDGKIRHYAAGSGTCCDLAHSSPRFVGSGPTHCACAGVK